MSISYIPFLFTRLRKVFVFIRCIIRLSLLLAALGSRPGRLRQWRIIPTAPASQAFSFIIIWKNSPKHHSPLLRPYREEITEMKRRATTSLLSLNDNDNLSWKSQRRRILLWVMNLSPAIEAMKDLHMEGNIIPMEWECSSNRVNV